MKISMTASMYVEARDIPIDANMKQADFVRAMDKMLEGLFAARYGDGAVHAGSFEEKDHDLLDIAYDRLSDIVDVLSDIE